MKRVLLMILFSLCWFAPTPVSAAGADFTISPDTTGSAANGYFQYTLQPQTQTTLAATINNTADHPQRFTVSIINAGVSSSGQLLYTPGAKLTATTGPTLAQLVTPRQQTVTVAAHASKVVQATIQVPATNWYGERLGALSVAALPDTNQQGGLQNRFVLATPLHLTISHPDLRRPTLTLTDSKLAGQTVEAALGNHAPRLFGDITMHTALQNAAKTTIATNTLNNAQMAPNAIMPVRLPITKALAPGKYTLVVDLTSGQQHYHLTDHFTISAAQAKDQHQTTAPAAPLAWWVYGLGVLIVVLLGIIGWLLWRQRRMARDANS